MVDHAVYLQLTPQQLGEVLRKASGDGAVSVASLLAEPGWELPSPEVLQERSQQADGTYFSMLLARGLLILAQLMDGEPVGVTDMAAELQMEPSTARRLISTLRMLGLVEHDPRVDRYRIAR
jgi:DNA-binding transcriptional ArsR family regulator